jgi:acyl-CoA dehydrogenase
VEAHVSWEFEADAELQTGLAWAQDFVRTKVEPLDFGIPHAWDQRDPVRKRLIVLLQDQVRERGLWAAHLGPELGGPP